MTTLKTALRPLAIGLIVAIAATVVVNLLDTSRALAIAVMTFVVAAIVLGVLVSVDRNGGFDEPSSQH